MTGRDGRHPVFVGKADKAVLGRRLLLLPDRRRGGGEVGEVVIVQLGQLAVHDADGAFMQDEEILKLRQALTRDIAIGDQIQRLAGGVRHRLGDGEHILLIHRDLAAEGQALAIVPDQRDRGRFG